MLSVPRGRWSNISVAALPVLVISIELAIIRASSVGRYAGLHRLDDTLSLSIAHSATKGLLFGTLLILLAQLIRPIDSPLVVARPRARQRLWILHSSVFALLLILLPTLPLNRMLPEALTTQLAVQYAASSVLFAGLGCTLLALTLRRDWLRWRYGIALAFIVLLLGDQFKALHGMAGLRATIEGTTLQLTLLIYGLFGQQMPELVLGQGFPILAVPDFAIRMAPQCSGYQGVAAALTLLGLYILAERRQLRLERAIVVAILTAVGTFLLNALRIALLFYIGAEVSPEIAVNGFHSHFGTLSVFISTGIGILVLETASFRKTAPQLVITPAQGHGAGLAERMLPLAVLLLVGIIVGLTVNVVNWLYGLPIAAACVALWMLRYHVSTAISQAPTAAGFLCGVGVFVLWVMLVPPDPEQSSAFADALFAAPGPLVGCWIIIRVIGASLVVPLVEELAFRGALQPLIAQGLDGRLRPMSAQTVGVMGAGIAFGLLHGDILAGTMAGLAYGALAAWRGNLTDAVLAHAVTNFLLALTVLGFGHWSYW